MFYKCVEVKDKKVYISLTGQPVVVSSQTEVKAMAGIATYTFDQVFDSEATQQQIYDKMVQPSIEHVLKGIDATVFAYGQTGSGKTYTM